MKEESIVSIVKVLGDGYFGITYLARVVDLKKRRVWGKEVAIKVPKDEKREAVLVDELITNAALHISLKGIDSENIVKYLGVHKIQITEQDRYYSMVMEYCPLGSLRNLIGDYEQQKILPLPQIISIVSDVCNGLKVAHRCGLYHRDIKPENILLTYNDQKKMVAKIGDFGISKFLTYKEFTESVRGSIFYMPPDAIKGKATFSSDIYSLGIVFYEMVTGRLPFTGENMNVIFEKIMKGNPASPHSLNSGIDTDLSAIIMRMIEPDPEKRYQTIGDVQLALQKYAEIRQTPPVENILVECDELLFRNNIELAEEKLRRLAEKYPDNPTVLLRLGELYNRCRHFPDAITVFATGIQRFPDQAIFYRDLALVLSKIGEIKDAKDAMHRALEIGLEENLQTHAEKLLEIWNHMENSD
jgi:serine/threonine protein kinase